LSVALLEVEDLYTQIPTERGTVRAVDGVSLRIEAGEAVALVGESGCGKSMTALSIMRLLRPPGRTVSGSVRFEGADLLALPPRAMRHIRGARIAMVFQDPMTYLNPLARVGAQIAEAVVLHQGASARVARSRAMEALERVRVPSPARTLDLYPHQLTGGMRQRVLIAIAVVCRPALLIADEPTTSLDVTIQAQIMRLLADLRRELGSALVLITHDLGLVAEFCDRVNVMYAGQIVESADAASLFAAPSHPYTKALLRSTLSTERRSEQFIAIEGQPPDLASPPPGCRFHPRCDRALARCTSEAPASYVSATRSSRCWLAAP
jgi:oligopeptide/dipeptide ABC transporter ATP-binding protein